MICTRDTGPRGIIRTARRPLGWLPPGPAPVIPRDRDDVWPGPDEDLCYLAGDWRILQRLRGHRWSLDDLVTAWFAAQLCARAPPARCHSPPGQSGTVNRIFNAALARGCWSCGAACFDGAGGDG